MACTSEISIPYVRTPRVKSRGFLNVPARYEGAAALIACGADLNLQNARRWRASDFAEEQSPGLAWKAVFGFVYVGRL